MREPFALTVDALSHQSGHARFPDKKKEEPPAIAKSRNNLTALSQYYNLLFIAYRDEIYVYKPSYPDQHVLSPRAILSLRRSQPGLEGFIDCRHPHAVNHLVVADLGIEELVIVACDDGDVVVYCTRLVCECVEKEAPDFNDSTLQLDLNPFFIRNVGKSAWGIAVHTQARLIAVSANTQVVTVFAFALSFGSIARDTGDSEDEVDDKRLLSLMTEGGRDWSRRVSFLTPFLRFRGNYQLQLDRHQSNIPSIAFYNSCDEEKIYLASTDINGHIIIWDVYSQTPLAELGDDERREWCHTRGWGIVCLDSRFANVVNNMIEMHGCDPRPDLYQPPPERLDFPNWDISKSIDGVPDSDRVHPSIRNQPPRPLQTTDAADGHMAIFDLDANSQFGEDDIEEVDALELIEDTDDFDEDAMEDYQEHEEVEIPQDSITSNPSEPVNPFNQQMPFNLGQVSDVALLNFQSGTGVQPLGGNTYLFHLPPLMPELQEALQARAIRQQQQHRRQPRGVPPLLSLPFNVLHTSQDTIKLLHRLHHDQGIARPALFSKTVCYNALNQECKGQLTEMRHYQRLNMVLQVPELGLVAVADQMGRVALIALTKSAQPPPGCARHESMMRTTDPMKKPTKPSKKMKRRIKMEEAVGFRLCAILPTKAQEDAGMRPVTLLLGMAIAPVQGHQHTPKAGDQSPTNVFGSYGETEREGRKWRLLLTYYDHTILSYEISRRKGWWDDEVLVV
ncbi:MAG: hypothetical protein Q9167_002120 [Letrouitia subvulpina]